MSSRSDSTHLPDHVDRVDHERDDAAERASGFAVWGEIWWTEMYAAAWALRQQEEQTHRPLRALAEQVMPYLTATDPYRMRAGGGELRAESSDLAVLSRASQRRGADFSTLARWRNPIILSNAKFGTLRAVVESLGYTMSELVAAMDNARDDLLAQKYGAYDRAPGALTPDEVAAQQRQERELLRNFRALSPTARRMLSAQVGAVAKEERAQRVLNERARAASLAAGGLPRPTDDLDEALAQFTTETEAWSQPAAQRAEIADATQRKQRSGGDSGGETSETAPRRA